MSQPDLINAGVYEEKPSSTIYTACLGISFLSLCIVSWLLSLELKTYNNDFQALEPKKMVVPLVAPPLEEEIPVTPEGDVPAEAPAATPAAATPSAAPAATASTDLDAAMPAATATPAGSAPAASGTAPAPAPTGTAPAPTGTAPADPDAAPAGT